MQTIQINNPVKDHFSMVPNAVWQLPVSCEAKAILGYLLSVQSGSAVRVADIETTLSIGRDRRRKAMAELKEVGLIRYVVTRCSDNRIVMNSLVLDTQSLLCPKPSISRPPEFQSTGNSSRSGNPPLDRLKSTPSATRFQGPITKQNKTKGFSDWDFGELGKYAKAQALAGNDIPIGAGRFVKAGTAEHDAIVADLRKQGAH